ncbi:MAG: hypothetical protein JNK58_07960 [Phycisphaerae bacterium]|nr:hypothetical protein [Phycisphaerae bacterium]
MQTKMCMKSAMLTVTVAGLAGVAVAGGPFPGPAPIGPDMTMCQLYGFAVSGRTGTYPNGMNGATVGTTSWNIGNAQLVWEQSPDPDHPKIGLDLFRKKTFTMNGVQVDRLEHIGQSWCKHGFFALSNQQCGTHPFAGQNGVPANGNCVGTDGTRLGIGCTDTYSPSLNATQSGLGPRFEINPWTGGWAYTGSMFQVGGPSNTAIRRRLQFRDQDLIPPGGTTYNLYFQGYYVCQDDVDVFTSAGWKPVTSYSWTGSTWSFGQSSQTTDENMGFAYDAWTGARQTLIAQQFPVIETYTANLDGPGGLQESPDGRSMILSKVFDLGNGSWQYEYAIYNIDMNRQIGSFTVPVPPEVSVTSIGWSAVFSHDEPTNVRTELGGKAVDNQAWNSVRNSGDVTWSTDPYLPTSTASNPLRWGTMYNFWFTATTGPTDGLVTAGLFMPGTPTSLDGLTNVPSAVPPPPHCMGDADGDNDRDFSDISTILANWDSSTRPGDPGDSNADGIVDFADITATLAMFGQPCN